LGTATPELPPLSLPTLFRSSVVSRSPYSEPSPFSTAAPSFLWNPLPVKLVYEQTGFLWNWHAPVTPVLNEPPAISIRPKQRKTEDRKSTRLNSSHVKISYAV